MPTARLGLSSVLQCNAVVPVSASAGEVTTTPAEKTCGLSFTVGSRASGQWGSIAGILLCYPTVSEPVLVTGLRLRVYERQS